MRDSETMGRIVFSYDFADFGNEARGDTGSSRKNRGSASPAI